MQAKDAACREAEDMQIQVAGRVAERHDSEATKQVVCKLRQMQGVLCSA